jgi:pimeloyl-ACP methyl ester carboxylesterase
MAVTVEEPATIQPIAGINIELRQHGQGRPILFLHPEIGFDFASPAIDALAKKRRVVAPSHPGFGRSEVPRWMSTVDDLAYFYLDLMDELDLNEAALVGISVGAWIAAAIAIKSTARISHLVLADAVGIKAADRETREIPDIFALTEPEYLAAAYADANFARRDYTQMDEAELKIIARNREATARYAWSPYMHDPKLKRRLHRIDVPTLLLWGDKDKITPVEYGRAYAAEIPGARLEIVPNAGHFPHAEQAQAFAGKVLGFVGQ